MKKQSIIWVIITVIMSMTIITCKKEDNISLPIVKTYIPVYVASTSATIGCIVESDGGSDIICGLYMGTSEDPETTGTQFQIDNDTGIFLGQVTGLLPNTKYYVKAYAKNIKGESLGEQVSFTTPERIADYENNIYESVRIGNQLWMASNLITSHYLNGDIIETTIPPTLDISDKTSPAYQWVYDGSEGNGLVYGRLYTFYAITDSRKICPAGWHIPTDSEWTILESATGGFNSAGSWLKESGNSHWIAPYNTDASNVSLFSALPGGYRNNTGEFSYIGNYGYWWSSTEGDINNAWVRSLFVQSGQVTRVNFMKRYGASVRCIKD